MDQKDEQDEIFLKKHATRERDRNVLPKRLYSVFLYILLNYDVVHEIYPRWIDCFDKEDPSVF